MRRKIWTYDLCKQEAKKYKTRTEFQKKSQSAYNACFRNAWIEDVCSHMILKKKPSGYWDFDKCKQEASKYKCYKDFYSNCPSAVRSSRKNGWIKLNRRPTGAVGATLIKWDYEACLKESMKYETRFDFMKNSKPAYNSCTRNGWLELIYENLPPVRKPPGFYSLDKCIELVKNVEKISHIKEEHPTALRLIYENGWKEIMKENVGLNIKNKL